MATPPAWISVPYANMQLQQLAPVALYHQYRPTNLVPANIARGLFVLGIGLSTVLGLALYETGHRNTAFAISITTATITSFIAAAQSVATYQGAPFTVKSTP